MKEIKIGNQIFNISCHASAQREYREIFDRSIFKDINTASDFFSLQIEKTKEIVEINPDLEFVQIQRMVFDSIEDKLEDFIDCITRLCWICIYDNNKKIVDYEIWFNSLERLSLSDEWIVEVLALCANCFC